MFDFLKLYPDAFGLDISDLSLKIVKLKKQGRFFSLACFGESNMKPGIVEKGDVKDFNLLADAIIDAVKRAKGEPLKTNRVVASLPEEKSFAQVIQMPQMQEHELAKAIIYEAENYIPLSAKDAYLDFQIVKPLYNHTDYLDVLIAAAPKKVADGYFKALRKACLKPLALEIESQAIARALIKDQVSPVPVLIIDLGATRTSFMIFAGFSLRFSSFVPISLKTFTKAIARSLDIDFKKADELRIRYGLDIKKKDVFEALIPVVTDLLEQIKRQLSFYETHPGNHHLRPNGSRVHKVLLCGGGANLKGLPEFLSKYLAVPVEIGNPWVNILASPLKQIPSLPFKDSLRYTTALGLALRGVKKYD